MRDVIVLRYGELFLKGGNRGFFERKLAENCTRALDGIPGAEVQRRHARIMVAVPAEEQARALDRLGRVFGIQSISPARTVEKDLDAIAAQAIEVARLAVAHRGGRTPTFKVETRRSDKRFPMSSPEISREVGGRVIDALGLPVHVHKPDLEIGLEIATQHAFVFAETLPGPGGLPVGVTGRVNLLLSGGIDSPVAGWLAMKRGCTLLATYFHSFPYTGDRTKEKVIDLLKHLAPWQGEIPLYVVGFTDVQKALREAGPGELAVVLYRRMMLRTAELIARHESAKALVTGDNLAQVASQTLENLATIESVATMPVLRPLLTNDKVETVALAQRIGTYQNSIQPYEDCCSLFVPDHPATKAKVEDVTGPESKLDIAELAKSLWQKSERIVVK